MKPYWTSPDGLIVVFHARWEDVLAAGLIPVREVALVHADPPYGIGDSAHRPNTANVGRVGAGKAYPPMPGNDRPYDPSPLLALGRPSVFWGANHYADKLPASPAWWTWDKREHLPEDKSSDGEIAWTNIGGSSRIFRHFWRWGARASESGFHVHQTQKPIALCSWAYARAKLRPGDLVLVPYLGSGPDLPAAVAMGLRVIACDVERWCCDTAIGRLRAVTPERAAESVGPLFGSGT